MKEDAAVHLQPRKSEVNGKARLLPEEAGAAAAHLPNAVKRGLNAMRRETAVAARVAAAEADAAPAAAVRA